MKTLYELAELADVSEIYDNKFVELMMGQLGIKLSDACWVPDARDFSLVKDCLILRLSFGETQKGQDPTEEPGGYYDHLTVYTQPDDEGHVLVFECVGSEDVVARYKKPKAE